MLIKDTISAMSLRTSEDLKGELKANEKVIEDQHSFISLRRSQRRIEGMFAAFKSQAKKLGEDLKGELKDQRADAVNAYAIRGQKISKEN